ncbi:macro domain-containing protein [Kribbella sancticallisti]|uniref:Macro domain-containing protein n=1 Tax=Kribbella sancticallisti TaxID=460087 RepID=A0ABN2EDT4_9ACTN
MMEITKGNILDTDAEAVVNTVNTVGVMGKGIALQFKQAYPDNYKAYRAACDREEVKLGNMFVFDTGRMGAQRYIINFPTKAHWKSRSKIPDIISGLQDLIRVIREYDIRSIAVPALGCGNGGLRWDDVLPLITKSLGALADVDVRVFPPSGAPDASEMRVATKKPRMSPGRAALLALLTRYTRLSQEEQVTTENGASLLEIQKLMYLLQTVGEPLRLAYTKAQYGPYAENLNHVLQQLEGHYLRGYGDRSEQILKLRPLELLPEAENAERWLDEHPDSTLQRIDAVLQLIAGFASPYGLELLTTVHWVSTHDDPRAGEDPDVAVALVQQWSARKGHLFTTRHVKRAWERLEQSGWLATV